MIQHFKNDDGAYLAWIDRNPAGYVVNVDAQASVPQYPMVHRATHALISSPHRTNYTSNQYVKFCSNDLAELERMAIDRYRKPLNFCKTCMRPGAAKKVGG